MLNTVAHKNADLYFLYMINVCRDTQKDLIREVHGYKDIDCNWETLLKQYCREQAKQ